MRHKFARIAVSLLLLGLAVALGVWLLSSPEEAERTEPTEGRPIVETVRVERGAHQLEVEAAGIVVAARDVTIQPQVAGRIVEVHDQFVPGGIVREGEVVFRIDPSDYRLAVEEQRTALEQARAELEQEMGRQEIAEREWELFEEEVEDTNGEGDASLALREPQLRAARVAVEAARARLERAQLDLERTTIEAPFDAFVESESVDVGQFVGTQSQVARLVGTDTFWVRVSVPVEQLPYIDLPGGEGGVGSPARIRHDVGARTIERKGRVVRLLGGLEEAGRMAQILVAIEDPFGLDTEVGSDEAREEIPLLLDAYVDVVIAGPTVEGLIEVPREALHEGDRVHAFADGVLDVRRVGIAWRRDETVLVDQGLSGGEEIVTSPIATPVDGMPLRRASQPERTSPPPGTGGGPTEPQPEEDAGE